MVNRNWYITELEPIQFPLINKFYRQFNVRGSAKRQDRVWVVRAKDKQIIATCRLTQITLTCHLLVGVYVCENYRGQGVARNLITHVCKCNKSDLYTFPYRHLTALYLSCNFVESSSIDDCQAQIKTLYNAYLNQGRDILLMHHNAL